jgi:hypothetical protein
MAEIHKTQSFPAPLERCREGLTRIWPYLDMKPRSSNPSAGIAEVNWTPGSGSVFVFRLAIKTGPDGQTEVTLRHDLSWTQALSRPLVNSEKMGQMLAEKASLQMEKVFSTLEEFLADETKFPKGVAPASLDMDHLAWLAGSAVSVGLRFLAAQFQTALFPSLQGADGKAQFLRALGMVGVLIGAAAAGLVKRRKPSKGSAFFEGVIVAIINIWMSLLFYKSFFTMSAIDWVLYGLVGITAASVASLRLPARKSN